MPTGIWTPRPTRTLARIPCRLAGSTHPPGHIKEQPSSAPAMDTFTICNAHTPGQILSHGWNSPSSQSQRMDPYIRGLEGAQKAIQSRQNGVPSWTMSFIKLKWLKYSIKFMMSSLTIICPFSQETKRFDKS